MLNEEFNTWQQDYTAKIRRWVPAYDHLIAHLTTFPEAFTPKDILDLGSGNGNVVANLLEKYPAAQYTLVDASHDMILATQERFATHADFSYKEKYFQDLNFLPNSFDLVTACLAFHHLNGKEKKAIFAQLFRWLRPGGKLSISDLFASKENIDYETTIIRPWEAYAKEQGTPDEEWIGLMEHHAEFDFPDTLENHIYWLKEVGFQKAKTTFLHGDWGNLQVTK
ncbi:MAG: class I SAM-dependent methyltransferase [Bacteroidota bacterium]